jgi:DNA-binding beta-propeller fold protein YncE
MIQGDLAYYEGVFPFNIRYGIVKRGVSTSLLVFFPPLFSRRTQMKKIIALFLGVALLALTGCPQKPVLPPPAPGYPDTPEATTPEGTVQESTSPEATPSEDQPAAAKSTEVLERIAAYKAKWGVTPEKNGKYKPKLLVSLTGDMSQPDGMTVNPKTKTIFLNCPNFNYRPNNEGPKKFPGTLVRVKLDGDKLASVEKLFVYEEKVPFPETGQVGPMGLYFGPDGHLYVGDNQYFFNTNNKSRMLRVKMDGDNPTGEVEVVVEGIKLANAVLWVGDKMYVTDTFLDREGEFGGGCVWMFTMEELAKAGTDGNPPIKVNPIQKMEDDPHCISVQTVKQLPGCGNGGIDGITVDKDGVLYFGNFGNGEMYRLVFDADGKPITDIIHEAGDYFGCCDGIFYDADTNKIYINDSQGNAIHAFAPPAPGAKAVLETLWENGDTDGADGSLDQPCECVIVDGKMVIANFDWPFPELLNTKTQEPNTLSVINLK